MKSIRRHMALAAMPLLLGASLAQAQNLLVNGSFEDGAFVNQGNQTMSPAAGSTVITGWTVVTDSTACRRASPRRPGPPTR